MPVGHAPPPHPLQWYKDLHLESIPGFKIPRMDKATLCIAGREGPSCLE
jgi:hypothetical protein